MKALRLDAMNNLKSRLGTRNVFTKRNKIFEYPKTSFEEIIGSMTENLVEVFVEELN